MQLEKSLVGGSPSNAQKELRMLSQPHSIELEIAHNNLTLRQQVLSCEVC